MQSIKLPALESAVWKDHLAALAPLPEVFVEHIYNNPGALNLPRSQQPLDQQIWQQIQHARRVVSYFLTPVVDSQERTSVDWFKQKFQMYSGKERTLPRTTVDDWQKRNLLRTTSHGVLEPNSIASVFMLRFLFLKDHRSWLPTRQKADSAWFYVWGLQPDDLIPRMYPYPLPDGLPGNTLLWSQWLLASTQPGWCKVPGVGSLAWARSIQHNNNWYWHLTEEELAAWDSSLVRDASVQRRIELFAPIFQSYPPQSPPDPASRYRFTRLNTLATLVLQHIGEPILAGYVQHYFGADKPPSQPYKPF